jgi:hypothetical protein
MEEVSSRAKSITICNVGPEHFGPLQRSYSRALNVPACPKGTSYVSVVIPDHTDMRVVAVDHWAEHSEKTPVLITCQEIVADIFNSEKMGQKGCFIPKGAKPTETEIEQAHAARRTYGMKCVNDGNAAYSINARIDDIPGEWKRYAEELGIDVEWCKLPPPSKTECPACAGEIKPYVAVCRHCGAILDKKKALEFGFIEETKPEPKGKVI